MTNYTPKQRMLNAYRGEWSDRAPVAPEFWVYYPAKLLDVDMIEDELLLRSQFLQIEAERADIGRQLGSVFLEHHEHAGLAILRRPTHEEFHGEHCLARARTATDEGRPTRGQSTACDFIKARNAGGAFGQVSDRGYRIRLQNC